MRKNWPFKCPICKRDLTPYPASGVWGHCSYQIFECPRHGFFVYVSTGKHGRYFHLKTWEKKPWNWREVDKILEKLRCDETIEPESKSSRSIFYYLKKRR